MCLYGSRTVWVGEVWTVGLEFCEGFAAYLGNTAGWLD
jgi:hypothetical protein